MADLVDIFDEQILIDEDGIPVKNQGEKTKGQKLEEDVEKFLAGSTALATEAATFPASVPIGLFNMAASINDGPAVPSPTMVTQFIRELSNNEYNLMPKFSTTAEYITGFIAGEAALIGALNKIQSSSPKTYSALQRMFPYTVGQLHTGISLGVADAKNQSKRKRGKNPVKGKKVTLFDKLKGGAKGLIKNIIPTTEVLGKVANNSVKIGQAGLLYSVLSAPAKEAFTTSKLGDGTVTGRRNQILNYIFQTDDIRSEYDKFTGTTRHFIDGMEYEDDTIQAMVEQIELLQQAIRAKDDEKSEEFKKRFDAAPLVTLRRYPDPINPNKATTDSKASLIMSMIGNSLKDIPAIRNYTDLTETGEDRKDNEIYDMFSETDIGIAEEAKDKALNEQYENEKQVIQQAPFVDNPKLMSTGGILETLQQNDPDKELRESGELPPLTEMPSDQILQQANVFEDTSGLPDQYETANLFGKVPIWAIENIDKFKMLAQNLTNKEKKRLESTEKKIGSLEEVELANKPVNENVDIMDTGDGTTVMKPKDKKSIIDSPEGQESIFYSNLEARLMDPNTPPIFNSADQFFTFMQNKQISKPEIDDNILTSYIENAKKNGTPLSTRAMLNIVRQAPLRKINSVTYGTSKFGGEKSPKYPGYQENGALPGSYREDVLFLDPKFIPSDPDQIPGSVHDFSERYVIGWSRLTDREATVPGLKGLFTDADKSTLKTLEKNNKKLSTQLDGLYASAYTKLRRETGFEVLGPIEELTNEEIKIAVNRSASGLIEIDEPLVTQIAQFENKIQGDAVKIANLKQAQSGTKTIITFADEIQSDILQQAKKLELELKEQIGDLLDLPLDERMAQLARDRIAYRGKARSVEPQVLEYYTKNETIFRPMFKTVDDMQQFIDEFRINKKIFEDLAKQGPSPEPQLIASAKKAAVKEKKMLSELDVGLTDSALKQLFPNVPFKNRMEWGSALIKRDIANAAKRLYVDKADDAAQWYAVSPAKFVKNRYNQRGGTDTPVSERNADMKGIGTEEFYGGPDSVDSKGKHYTSTVEKILKKAAKENNSEFKIIQVDGIGDVFAIKITPEMLLPHKTHRKRGGLVYTPSEIIDIFEAA